MLVIYILDHFCHGSTAGTSPGGYIAASEHILQLRGLYNGPGGYISFVSKCSSFDISFFEQQPIKSTRLN